LIGASADEIESAVRRAGFSSITRAGSMDEAVAAAASAAAPGDTVVLAPGCASFDMFGSFEERGEVFKSAVKRRTTVGCEDRR
jgi:UDP-N-acetylmuramoylalanine--D-glutamate ligase